MTAPIEAHDVEPERVTWLWRERIPRGMISIVGGRPDQGKGLFCAHLAAAVSKTVVGRNPDDTPRFGRVLYSAIEDSHGLMTRPRLEAAGANLHNVFLWRFQIPAMMRELEAYIIDKEIDLLVMDPFAAHLSHGISRHSDNIRNVLTPLSGLIETTRTAVVVVEHVLKRVAKSGHPLAAIGGSGSGLPAASRMAFLFGGDPDDDDSRFLVCVKSNICERPKAVRFSVDSSDTEVVSEVPSLVYDSEEEFDAMRLLESDPTKAARGMGRPPDKRAAASEWLTNYLYLARTPVRAGVVMEDAKQAGMTIKTLRRACADMEVVRNPPGGGQGCVWSLPDELTAALDEAAKPAGEKKDDQPEVDGNLLTDDDLAALLGGDDE